MRILTVDDDPKFRNYIQRGLEESDIECAVASDAEEALEALRAGPSSFHLILLDVMMPGATGWDFLERLRGLGNTTPVIFLTARSAVDERVKGLRLGADDYIIKPFEFTELLARIEAVVRRHQPGSMEVGDLRIELTHRTVERSGQRIDLSPREFDLLCALVEGKGRVLGRTELLKRIWAIDFDPGTNVVDVLVGRLRRRIDRTGRPLIETVKNEGYRIAAEEKTP